ncbi:NB-ARC domain-containing protein [Streptomyces sp. FXJ1.4098]|nr:NB-ARC domain-containing protein [Streptomyces sp. FXJ1.4098]
MGRAPAVLRDRADLMRRLRTAVGGDSGQIHVLHGMGGCGKTAVAHALFAEAVRDRARVGLWVNASERLSLRAGMLAVAADRGAGPGELAAAHSGQRAAADLVWHHLDHSAEPWLLVIDNADDPAILEEGGWLRASPRGTVLVTTRYATSRAWRGAVLHPVGVLPTEDAAQVLCDLAPHAGTPAAAEQVALRLGCLPLALTLAGSYLHHQLLESWSMDEYRNRLETDPTGLIDQGAALDSGRPSPATWSAEPGSCPWTPSPTRASPKRQHCYGSCPAGARTRCRSRFCPQHRWARRACWPPHASNRRCGGCSTTPWPRSSPRRAGSRIRMGTSRCAASKCTAYSWTASPRAPPPTSAQP